MLELRETGSRCLNNMKKESQIPPSSRRREPELFTKSVLKPPQPVSSVGAGEPRTVYSGRTEAPVTRKIGMFVPVEESQSGSAGCQVVNDSTDVQMKAGAGEQNDQRRKAKRQPRMRASEFIPRRWKGRFPAIGSG
jgi:hypothetical protein